MKFSEWLKLKECGMGLPMGTPKKKPNLPDANVWGTPGVAAKCVSKGPIKQGKRNEK